MQEELEQARRDWSRERSELSGAAGAAEARARDLADELDLLRAALPPPTPHAHDRGQSSFCYPSIPLDMHPFAISMLLLSDTVASGILITLIVFLS
jgi:hypothetical protein